MKKITFAVILFVFFTSLAGLFIGGFISRFFMPENPGLVGGAIVMFYAVIGLVLGFIAGLVFWRFLEARTIRIINLVLGIGCLGMISWLTYRYINRPKASGETRSETPKVTKPTAPAIPIKPSTVPDPVLEDSVSIGLGMGKPLMEPDRVIYFYNTPEVETPSDSLIFSEGPYHLVMDETSSPMNPEHLKLDYQMCFFLVKNKEGKRLEVVTNKQSNQTAWVREEQMDLLTWPRFLTSIHSVEPINWSANPVRMSPDDGSDTMPNIGPNYILEAKSRSGDWLNVVVSDQNYQSVGRGWVRWRKDGVLVLKYNLLS